MRDLDRQAWIERARAVPIMDELARRGIKLRRKGSEHEGPCPKCGGRAYYKGGRPITYCCRDCRYVHATSVSDSKGGWGEGG